MKFVVSTGTLAPRVQNIRGVIASKSQVAILDCFLFETQGLTLTITAGDADNRLVTSLELIECDEDARFCVNAKTLLDLIRELNDQPVSFEVDLELMKITVRYLNGEFNITSLPAADYPQLQGSPDGADTISMSCAFLHEGITCCMTSVAEDTVRPQMAGIFVDVTDQGTIFVATDGHKMVRDTVPASNDKPFSFILPKKISTLLRIILPKEEGDVAIATDGKSVRVTTAEYTMTGKLIEGRYPNYNSVIPKNNPFTVQIDRSALLGAVRRVSLLSSQSSSLIKIRVADNDMTLSGQDYDFATSAEEHVLCQYTDTPVTIGFKGSLLSEMLGILDCDEICLQLADARRPGIIVPAHKEENKGYILVLLMPMMVKD